MGEPTLVYFKGGKLAHVLKWNSSPNRPADESLCGRAPWPDYWYGTGDMDERDTARQLPLCMGCRNKVKEGG